MLKLRAAAYWLRSGGSGAPETCDHGLEQKQRNFMKHLYLHIGLGKTGSSALQSWLSLNARRIGDQGFDYADLVPEAKSGSISSGNGDELVAACRNNDFVEVERLLNEVYFFSGKNERAIVSCELLQGMSESRIQQLRETCDSSGIQVTVIAFVRSIYEQAYSSYLQGLKRGGNDHLFGDKPAEINSSSNIDYIKRYYIHFGDRVTVLNYDHVKDDVYSAFAGIVGFRTDKFKRIDKKINRSVTREEADVLREMNSLHGGRFATQISDYMIAQAPDVQTQARYIPEIVEKVREKSGSNVNWINRQFKLDPPLVSDFYAGHEKEPEVVLTEASYQPVIDWVMSYGPNDKQLEDFHDFLLGLADFLEVRGYAGVAKIRDKARRWAPKITGKSDRKPEVQAEDKPVADTGSAQAQKFEMTELPDNEYLLSFKLSQPDTTVEQLKAALIELHHWMRENADKSILSYSMMSDSIELARDGTITGQIEAVVQDEAVMVMRAASMDEAVSFAQSCPQLSASANVTVSLLKNPLRVLL